MKNKIRQQEVHGGMSFVAPGKRWEILGWNAAQDKVSDVVFLVLGNEVLFANPLLVFLYFGAVLVLPCCGFLGFLCSRLVVS